MVILLLFLFITGCFFGSFLLVLIDRLPRGEKITGRSHCEFCNHVLSWKDLIPVISFLSLKGKCRYCKKTLSYYYPALEIITGIVFVLLYFQVQFLFFPYIIYVFIVVSMLLVLFFTDIRSGLLPFPIIAVLCIVTGLYFGLYAPELLLGNFFSGIGALLFFLVIFLLTRGRGMGFGDVVYVFWMGFALGFPGIVFGLYVAFLTGAIVSLILILLGLKKLRGGSIPFGPFLIFGTVLLLFWEQQIMQAVRYFLPI